MSRSDSVLFVGSWKHRRLHDNFFFCVLTAIGITATTSFSAEWRMIERWWVYLCLPNERHKKEQTIRCVETRAQDEKCTRMKRDELRGAHTSTCTDRNRKNIVPNAYYTLQITWWNCCWDDDWWPARWVIVCFRLFFCSRKIHISVHLIAYWTNILK